MNQPLARKACAVLLSAFILLGAYYGSFLPMRKSQIFISAMRDLRSVTSVAEFKNVFARPLGVPSPIGQEELVRNGANTVLNVLQQTDKPEVIAELMDFVESSYRPIIERGRGMSFEQNLYIMGTLNELAFIKTQDNKYFAAAKSYYSEGLKLGPKRPQFLYGLFDIYRIEGNVEATKEIAAQILSQWPEDQRTKDALDEFMQKILTVKK
ncbi:MAG: hypothetical protein HY434_00600 [Candidatus Liptonbacteria bacterium]|nr:hypothetical protein [Parcubacteria group bacterium]MBI4087315.1 hypothetical protein [Candidatus Liptonbacteria bacterium]